MSNSNDGWNEWSKHVLKELQRLNEGQDGIMGEIHCIKSSLMKLSILENQVKDIKEWKENISEVTSPTQLKQLVDKVDALQSFKIKAVTLFMLVQVVIGIAIGVLN